VAGLGARVPLGHAATTTAAVAKYDYDHLSPFAKGADWSTLLGVGSHERFAPFRPVARAGVAADSEAGLALFRRTANVGDFAELDVPVQRRAVAALADRAGIGLNGVKWTINRDSEVLGTGLMGHTSPRGAITLFPDAFQSERTLVETLAEERIHVYQVRTFGPLQTSLDLAAYEAAAKQSASLWAGGW
jgi:hypothetical protein